MQRTIRSRHALAETTKGCLGTVLGCSTPRCRSSRGTLFGMSSTRETITRPGLLSGVWVFERHTFTDNRGFFREAFRLDEVEAAVNRPLQFVQMNHSRSTRNTLRGLHAENWDKLVYVSAGEVFTALA